MYTNSQTANTTALKNPRAAGAPSVTTYHEKKIGNVLYRVTSVYKGEFELEKALEDLTVRKILRSENDSMQCPCL